MEGGRCFGPQQTLSLADGDRAAKWTVILGENGVGKTTILQCAWTMAPHVQAPQPGARAGSGPRGFFGASAFLRRAPTSNASIFADVLLDELFTSPNVGMLISSGIRSPTMRSETVTAYPDRANVLCCGYGALRRSREASVEAGGANHSAASLFSDDAALINGSEWFLRADYAAKNATPDSHAAAQRDKIAAALIELLPDVGDIRAAGLDEQPPRPRVDVQTPYGLGADACAGPRLPQHDRLGRGPREPAVRGVP